jgi:hypothetical protein
MTVHKSCSTVHGSCMHDPSLGTLPCAHVPCAHVCTGA